MGMNGDLPGGWMWTTLENVCAINPGVEISSLDDGEFVSFVPMAAVQAGTGRIDVSQVRQLTDVRRGYTAFQDGDVIFAKITPCMENGKIAVATSLVSGIAFGSTEFHVLRPTQSVDAHFLYHAISRESFRREAREHMTGTAGQLRVPTKFLAQTNTPLPPLAEQRRIVAAIEQQFTRLDAGVAALKRVRAALKRYRASVLKAAVEGRLTEEWQAAHPDAEPAATLLARILTERRARWEADLRARGKDPAKAKYEEPKAPDAASLPELPQGWCWATVEQVSQSVRYGTSAKTSEHDVGVPVLRMGNIQDGKLDVTSLKFLPADHHEFPDLLLEDKDLLFNRTNSAELVGKSAVYNEVPYPCSYASYLIVARMVIANMSDYLCYYINSAHGRAWISSVMSQQVGQANVNGTKLGALVFPLPPLAEQEQIVAEVERRLSVVGELEATVAANLRRAERLRQSILERAFSGRLVPQDADDEPASALLARIREERAGGAMDKASTGNETPPVQARLL